MYIYGEISGLYRAGLVEVPEEVIKIWSDNGYGKMVSRRQGNENPRLPSLPPGFGNGPHGVYCHVTFHDLQASSHLTMLANRPEMVNDELGAALDAGADVCLLVNCGNIRPHILMLDLVARIWNHGKTDVRAHMADFGRRFFPSLPKEAMACYREYFNAVIQYGENKDDRAGDEFYHHPARPIAEHWMKGKCGRTCDELLWATGEMPFEQQVADVGTKCESALAGWTTLEARCTDLVPALSENEAVFFSDNLRLQVILHRSGCQGLAALCRGFAAWKDCNLPLEALRKWLRVLGDSPDFFIWYRDLLMPEREKKIYLENTHRRPLSDDELARMLEARLV